MLRPRITPCLLVHNGGLVKTIGFGEPKYVGDPINAVRIFNEKEVDELVVLDIDATVLNRDPDYAMIKNLAAECRMPLCYGGGVRNVAQVEQIVSLGVEKVAISAAAVENPILVKESAEIVGNQSIVAVLDVKKTRFGAKYQLFTHNGKHKTSRRPVEFAQEMESLGAGELVINSIDADGTMKGYDISLARSVRKSVSIPVTILGGAGTIEHIAEIIAQLGIIGAAAGSLFVFKGIYRAVLINYPRRSDKDALVNAAMAKFRP
jgi:cyclase